MSPARRRSLTPSPRLLWLLTASLVALNHIAMSYLDQGSRPALLCALAWMGALLCMEDRLPNLDPRPSAAGLGLGLLLLVVGLALSMHLVYPDLVTYGLAALQGLGLVLLAVRPGRWRDFRDPLLVLALLPAVLLLPRLLPEAELSQWTGRIVQVYLALGGRYAWVEGREVGLGPGGVMISGACAGTELISLLLSVAAIFALAFPLRRRWQRLAMIALSPLLAILGNALRIGVLALILGSDLSDKEDWFDFFHEEYGSLLFAGLTVSVFAWLYLLILERQLAVQAPHGS